MAAPDAAHRKPSPLEHPILLQGLHGVFRAGRREAAYGGCQTRNFLIHTNEQDKKLPHSAVTCRVCLPYPRCQRGFMTPASEKRAIISIERVTKSAEGAVERATTTTSKSRS